MLSIGKLAAYCRPAQSTARALSFFSSSAIPAAVSKTLPIPAGDNYTRFLPPTTMVPPPPLTLIPTPSHRRVNKDTGSDNLVMALKNLVKKEEADINKLQWMLESFRIARFLPTSKSTSTVGLVLPVGIVVPTYLPQQRQSQQQQPTQQQNPQHRTFQVMNRNARKAKRANHGKRPCSRIRRRYKVKAWANTSRKG